MKLYVGVTDNKWFKFLAQLQPDELNFWKPGGGSFRAIEVGAPFLFKLHSPYNYVVGGGFFVKHSLLPLSLAWEAFGQKNGALDFRTFREQIGKYRGSKAALQLDPIIGCIILAAPFFFEEKDWIPVPEDWSQSIVQGKTYDTRQPLGRALWEQVQVCLRDYEPLHAEPHKQQTVAEDRSQYGTEHLIRPRLGQGAFRVLVTEAYRYRCAVTGERTLPVLQASHIKPYAESGPHRVDNGLLMRADLHILFDRGFITVTDDYRVEVSQRIEEEYENGQEYYALHGKRLEVLPSKDIERPSVEFIGWHNQHVFSP